MRRIEEQFVRAYHSILAKPRGTNSWRPSSLRTEPSRYSSMKAVASGRHCHRQPNQLKKNNFQIVAVTLRLADPKFVACVEVDENRSFRGRVTDDVVEMQIAVRPCAVVIAALNLVDSPQFAGCKDEGFGRVPSLR